jgi:hypothetical protein
MCVRTTNCGVRASEGVQLLTPDTSENKLDPGRPNASMSMDNSTKELNGQQTRSGQGDAPGFGAGQFQNPAAAVGVGSTTSNEQYADPVTVLQQFCKSANICIDTYRVSANKQECK